MKVHQAFQTVLVAPLGGVVLYFWSIGQFNTMADSTIGSLLGFVFFSWLVAMAITLIIGFPIGLALSAVLRCFHRESLAAYLILGTAALILAILLGDPAMSTGFVVTASILAGGYWFFIAKPRIASEPD